jgi:sirohydrochlorin ferrochelatase
MPDCRVASATLAAPGSLEAALETLGEDSLIYPHFMSDGWFVRSALTKRVGDRPTRIMSPLGLDTQLVSVAARAVADVIQSAGWRSTSTRILLAAHGSENGPAAAASAHAFAKSLADALPCEGIDVAFVEEAPFLTKAAEKISGRTVCLPFFAMEGEHVRADVTAALRTAGFSGPILPALGQCPGVSVVIANAMRRERPGMAA